MAGLLWRNSTGIAHAKATAGADCAHSGTHFFSTQTGEMVPLDDLSCGCTGTEDGLMGLMGADALGEMAIALRGCDCAGCRFIARQEMQRQLQASISIPVKLSE